MRDTVRFFDIFPEELKKKVTSDRLDEKNYNNINKVEDKNINYAFIRLKKLPLMSKRNVLSAMTHFNNIARVTEEEKSEAYLKIIKAAESFQICTIVFSDKYKKYQFNH